MKYLNEPLKTILKHYCHVENFEVYELQSDMNGPNWKLNMGDFEKQVNAVLESPEDYIDEINYVTGNEFEDGNEVSLWLSEIMKFCDM